MCGVEQPSRESVARPPSTPTPGHLLIVASGGMESVGTVTSLSWCTEAPPAQQTVCQAEPRKLICPIPPTQWTGCVYPISTKETLRHQITVRFWYNRSRKQETSWLTSRDETPTGCLQKKSHICFFFIPQINRSVCLELTLTSAPQI